MRVKALLVALMVFTVLSASAASAAMEGISNIEWRVIAIRNEEGGFREVLKDTEITAFFSENGEIYGSAGCNRYMTNYSVFGDRIEIKPAASTRMFCFSPAGIMEQEAAFLRELAEGRFRTLRIMSCGHLEILDEDGKVALVLAEAGEEEEITAGLLGGWRVESMDGEKLLPGTEITMTFTEDGKLAGKATINRYFASWIEADGLILIGSAATTMMAGPENQMNQEAEFLKKLSKARSYEIQGKTLIMTMVGGGSIIAIPAKID